MPVVLIPTAYRGPTAGEAEVAVEGKTARDCLEAVEARFPGFLSLVIESDGSLHRFVKLFRNGDQLDAAGALDTELEAGDRLEVLAAIAGG